MRMGAYSWLLNRWHWLTSPLDRCRPKRSRRSFLTTFTGSSELVLPGSPDPWILRVLKFISKNCYCSGMFRTYFRIWALSRLLDLRSWAEHRRVRMERLLLAFSTCSFPSWVAVVTSVCREVSCSAWVSRVVLWAMRLEESWPRLSSWEEDFSCRTRTSS